VGRGIPSILPAFRQIPQIAFHTYLVKQAIKIYMDTISVGGIKQDIFTVSIAQPKYISNHRHHGGCTTIAETTVIPVDDGK
jgi:hypothetical protein